MDAMHPFPIGTRVGFDVEDLLAGMAVVVETQRDDGWLYRVSVVKFSCGDATLLERLVDVEPDGSAWLCEHEVQPLVGGGAA